MASKIWLAGCKTEDHLEVSFNEKVWGLRQGPQLESWYDELSLNDVIVFRLSRVGIVGVGVAKQKITGELEPLWPAEQQEDGILFPYRFTFEPIFPLSEDYHWQEHAISIDDLSIRTWGGLPPIRQESAKQELVNRIENSWELSNNSWEEIFAESRNQETIGESTDKDEQSPDIEPPKRTESKVSRIIRNTTIVKELKNMYSYQCQVCDETRRRGAKELYAEGHHLHPLGDTPPGLDRKKNILVLCPNHHADFDYGMIEIDSESKRISHLYDDEINGTELTVHEDHEISPEAIQYHNKHISKLDF